jgi:hypothetical protein
MRDAADLVANEGAFLGNETQQFLYERLGSVPPRRAERAVRDILNSDDPVRAKIEALARLADDEGLEVPLPIPTIEPVDLSQIHLVVAVRRNSQAVGPVRKPRDLEFLVRLRC